MIQGTYDMLLTNILYGYTRGDHYIPIESKDTYYNSDELKEHASRLAEWANLMELPVVNLDSVIKVLTPEANRFVQVSLTTLQESRQKIDNINSTIASISGAIIDKETELKMYKAHNYVSEPANLPIIQASITGMKELLETFSDSLKKLCEHDAVHRRAIVRAYTDAIANRSFKNSMNVLGACENLSAHEEQCMDMTNMLNAVDHTAQTAGVRNLMLGVVHDTFQTQFKKAILNSEPEQEVVSPVFKEAHKSRRAPDKREEYPMQIGDGQLS